MSRTCIPAIAFCLAGASVIGSCPAGAQPAEDITVTAAAPARAPSGTVVLGAADIARSGQATLGQLLDELPSFGTQGINAAQNDGGFGEFFVDLRSLNFDRTLVLVDGKRFVLSGIQTDEAVDLNNIPAAFIDHVEVLRDGSQPQYAADAVAGVVNVVLKDQVDGLHLDGYGAGAPAGGSGTADASLVGGRSYAGGHVAFGLDVFSRDPVLQSTRGWAALPIASIEGGQTLFGSPATLGGHAIGPGVDSLALGQGASRPYDPATDFFNPASQRYLQGGLQRATFYVDGDAALSDSISADAELLVTDRRATTLDPAQTLGLTGTARHPDGFVIPAGAPGDPFAVPATLERVVGEAGAQQTTTTGPVWRVLGGLEGTQGRWGWSLSIDHGESLSRYTVDNEIDLTRALQTVGAAPCAAASGCVPSDWFGPGSLSPQALAYVRYTGRSQSSYAETVGQAKASGPVFPLPGGQATLTLGGELRAESGATTVDAVSARGDQAGADAAPTSGSYDTYEAYATLAAPLLRDLWAVHRLDVALAARETATSRYGSFPTLRATIDFVPVAGLHLRAVTGTARRVPAISEAFGGITAAQVAVADPCAAAGGLRANPVVAANCAGQGLGPGFAQASPLIQVESGGDARLHPERAENEMLGATLAPPAAPWLQATVDWYHYRIRDAIDSLADTDPNLIGDACYESAHLSSPLCGLITRISGGGNAGQIGNILGLDENVGTIKTDGLEFGLTVTAPLRRGMQLRLDWQSNWLLDFRLHDTGQPGFTQYAGSFPGLSAGGSYARIRSRATATLERGAWSAQWTGRFTSGARVLDAAGGPDSSSGDVLYQDLEVSRQAGGVTAMLGVDNLLDVRPPTLPDGLTNTSAATYDVVGRLVFARLSYAF